MLTLKKNHRNHNVSLYLISTLSDLTICECLPHWCMCTIFPLNILGFLCQLLAHLYWPRTSTDRNFAGPAAVRAADTVLWTTRKEITRLTGVHQGVAIGGQVQTHNVSVGWAPRLLARVSWRASTGKMYQCARTHTDTHTAKKTVKNNWIKRMHTHITI